MKIVIFSMKFGIEKRMIALKGQFDIETTAGGDLSRVQVQMDSVFSWLLYSSSWTKKDMHSFDHVCVN